MTITMGSRSLKASHNLNRTDRSNGGMRFRSRFSLINFPGSDSSQPAFRTNTPDPRERILLLRDGNSKDLTSPEGVGGVLRR
jgi:hypothetical protein